MNLDEWRAKVHGLACEKGWWESSPDLSSTSVLAKLALVVSELSEAIELVREPGFDPKAVFMASVQGIWIPYSINPWSTKSVPKPEGFGTEMADAIIRVLDLMGALKMELIARDKLFDHGGLNLALEHADSDVLGADYILAAIMRVTSTIGRAADVVDDHPPASWGPEDADADAFQILLSTAVTTMCTLCARLDVDVGARVAEKHAYNATREHRHGGKRA